MDEKVKTHEGNLWLVKRKKKTLINRPSNAVLRHCVLNRQFLQIYSHEGGSLKKEISLAKASVEILNIKRVTKTTPTLFGFIFVPSLTDTPPSLSNLTNSNSSISNSSNSLLSNNSPNTSVVRIRNRSNTIGIIETVSNCSTTSVSSSQKIELITPYSFFTNSEDELMDWVRKIAQTSAFFTTLDPPSPSNSANSSTLNFSIGSSLPSSVTSKPLPSPRSLAKPLPSPPGKNNNNNNNNRETEEMRKQRMIRSAILMERFVRMIKPRRYLKYMKLRSLQLQRFARFLISRKSFLHISKENKYRKRVIDELLATETSYIDGLSVLVNSYIKPITPPQGSGQGGTPKFKRKTQQILTQNQIITLFSNVESILQLHLFLKSSLDKRLGGWFANQKIGDVFLSLVAQFKLYTQYINNYDKAMGLYTELIDPSNRNLKFTKFCSEIEQQFVGNQSGLKLNSFLILPVQRLPRYEMLLRDITKHTWKSHPDLPSLTKALAGIAEVTAFLNESKRTNENMSRMIEIRNKLAGQTIQNLDLLQPHRKMVREGPVVQHFPNGKSRERYLFLFSDLLLLSDEMLVRKLSKIQGTINYNTKYMVFFAAKKLDIIDLGEKKFHIKSRDASTDCLFEVEPKDKQLWLSDFQKTLEAYRFDN